MAPHWAGQAGSEGPSFPQVPGSGTCCGNSKPTTHEGALVWWLWTETASPHSRADLRDCVTAGDSAPEASHGSSPRDISTCDS